MAITRLRTLRHYSYLLVFSTDLREVTWNGELEEEGGGSTGLGVRHQTPSALTIAYCTTLGESLPFPEPRLSGLESEEGTERPPQPLPAQLCALRPKSGLRGNDAELGCAPGGYHNTRIVCADEELRGAAGACKYSYDYCGL